MDISKLFRTLLISIIAGIGGTGLGALVVISFSRISGAVLSGMLGFAGGVMLEIIFLDLIPEATVRSNEYIMFSGFFLGIICLALIDIVVSHLHMSERKNGMDVRQKKLLKTGTLLTIGIALHNFPEGLAIGSGLAVSHTFGLGIAILFALHNIPEGISLSSPYRASGAKWPKTIFFACIAGLPMVIGALVGYSIASLSKDIISICLGFAAGAMFFITLDELIPQAHAEAEKYGHIPIYSIVLGFLFALVIGKFVEIAIVRQ
jgi:ZIP family zinc transporter